MADDMVYLHIIIVTTFFLSICASHVKLNISTSTPTPCYGDVVTLVCHHPEVANNSQTRKYVTTVPTFRENGVGIPPAVGTPFTYKTAADLTHTILTINITVDYFRNKLKSFNYSCILVLADDNGRDTGEVETSPEINVDPVDLTPPHITKVDPLKTSITVRWTPQPCAVMYRVSWNYTNDDGTTTTGSGVSDQVTNHTIPTSVQGVYTVSVQAVDGVGNVGPATSEVVRSTYPRPTADAPPCEDRSLVLTCLVSGLHNESRSHFTWVDENDPLDNSNQYSFVGPKLMIANISAISDWENKTIRCGEALNNGIVVTGEVYMVEPLRDCPYSESPLTEGGYLAAAIAGPVVGVVIILTAVMVITCMLWIHGRKRKQGQYDIRPAEGVQNDH